MTARDLFLRGGGGGWDSRFRYFRLTVDSRSFNAQPFKCPKLRNNLFGETRRTYKDEEKRQFFLKKDSQYIFFWTCFDHHGLWPIRKQVAIQQAGGRPLLYIAHLSCNKTSRVKTLWFQRNLKQATRSPSVFCSWSKVQENRTTAMPFPLGKKETFKEFP